MHLIYVAALAKMIVGLVLQYTMAQLSTQARNLPRAGSSLLVLTSGNVDENLFVLPPAHLYLLHLTI